MHVHMHMHQKINRKLKSMRTMCARNMRLTMCAHKMNEHITTNKCVVRVSFVVRVRNEQNKLNLHNKTQCQCATIR